jgi:hypothetical protein
MDTNKHESVEQKVAKGTKEAISPFASTLNFELGTLNRPEGGLDRYSR